MRYSFSINRCDIDKEIMDIKIFASNQNS